MAITQLTEFAADELVSRANVNSRVSTINSDLDTLTTVSLYDNSSGTTSTIPLNSSIENYKAIEIMYGEDDYNGPWCDNLRIWNNQSSTVHAVLGSMYTDVNTSNKNRIRILGANISISGASLTWGYAKMATFISGSDYTVSDLTQYGTHKIYKVIGYKY